jgi:hypothetical protein
MKERVTMSLEASTVAYLADKARQSTGGNVSAYVDQLARKAALQESIDQHAAWYAAHPSVVEDAEAERLAAGDAGRDAA